MSQETLGKSIGVSFQQIQKYENGTNRITAGRLVVLANTLGISIMAFLDIAEPGIPARTIEGVRIEFNEVVRHLNLVGEAIGLAVKTELRK